MENSLHNSLDYQGCACVTKDWPYCVMAVGIDQVQQLALKLLQGRLEGDGQSVQGDGKHLEQLRPQQRISWGQCKHLISISTMPWHFHVYIIFTALSQLKLDFSNPGMVFIWASLFWSSLSKERNVLHKVWNIFKHVPVGDLFVKIPDIHHRPKKIYQGPPGVL